MRLNRMISPAVCAAAMVFGFSGFAMADFPQNYCRSLSAPSDTVELVCDPDLQGSCVCPGGFVEVSRSDDQSTGGGRQPGSPS
jgi:Thrombomodulin like fifth domain, EGF-like